MPDYVEIPWNQLIDYIDFAELEKETIEAIIETLVNKGERGPNIGFYFDEDNPPDKTNLKKNSLNDGKELLIFLKNALISYKKDPKQPYFTLPAYQEHVRQATLEGMPITIARPMPLSPLPLQSSDPPQSKSHEKIPSEFSLEKTKENDKEPEKQLEAFKGVDNSAVPSSSGPPYIVNISWEELKAHLKKEVAKDGQIEKALQSLGKYKKTITFQFVLNSSKLPLSGLTKEDFYDNFPNVKMDVFFALANDTRNTLVKNNSLPRELLRKPLVIPTPKALSMLHKYEKKIPWSDLIKKIPAGYPDETKYERIVEILKTKKADFSISILCDSPRKPEDLSPLSMEELEANFGKRDGDANNLVNFLDFCLKSTNKYEKTSACIGYSLTEVRVNFLEGQKLEEEEKEKKEREANKNIGIITPPSTVVSSSTPTSSSSSDSSEEIKQQTESAALQPRGIGQSGEKFRDGTEPSSLPSPEKAKVPTFEVDKETEKLASSPTPSSLTGATEAGLAEKERLVQFNTTLAEFRDINFKMRWLVKLGKFPVKYDYFSDFNKIVHEYTSFIGKFEDGSVVSLNIQKNKLERFNELQKIINEQNSKWNTWLTDPNPSKIPEKYKASAIETGSKLETGSPLATGPAPTPPTTLTSAGEPSIKIPEKDILNDWRPKKLESGSTVGKEISKNNKNPFVIEAISDSVPETDASAISYKLYRQQAGMSLAQLAAKPPETAVAAGKEISLKQFKGISKSWYKKIKATAEKAKEDTLYHNVQCSEPGSKGEITTTITFESDKTEQIKHSYDDRARCPKVTMTNPPDDKTIILFMESSKEMEPLKLQTKCDPKDALRLFEASVISGTKIELHEENQKELAKDPRYKSLEALLEDPDALKEFRKGLLEGSSYELGKGKLPEPQDLIIAKGTKPSN